MTPLKIPEPDLQIAFYKRLQDIRGTYLLDALLATVAQIDITQIDRELADMVYPSALSKVAGWDLEASYSSRCRAFSPPSRSYWDIIDCSLVFHKSSFMGADTDLAPLSQWKQPADFRENLLSRIGIRA